MKEAHCTGLPDSVTKELKGHNLLGAEENNVPQASTDKMSEEESVMREFIRELKIKGIEAEGRVGYATNITTPDWVVTVADQKDVGRRIITSYKNRQGEINAIRKALASPGFDSDEGFQATREFLEYNNRIVPIPLSNPHSPTVLCIQELKDRMVG